MCFVQIVVLAGGTGGARFLRGLRAAAPEAEITAVVNTGDDVTMHGLRICPDLDTVVYTLGGGIDEERGWGRAGESWTVKEELTAYDADPDWFGLGDRDLATHLIRTRMLDAGYPLSAVTAALADRWQPGVTLLPMSDQRVETHVVVADPDTGRQQAVHFQEWWVRHRAEPEARAFVQVGVDAARPQPRSSSMPPPRVYITVSRSGQIRSPCIVTSSPVLTTAVIDASGTAARTPRRNRAPPVPPASTTICTKDMVPDRQLSTVLRACRGLGQHLTNAWYAWGWCGVSLTRGEVDGQATTRV